MRNTKGQFIKDNPYRFKPSYTPEQRQQIADMINSETDIVTMIDTITQWGVDKAKAYRWVEKIAREITA